MTWHAKLAATIGALLAIMMCGLFTCALLAPVWNAIDESDGCFTAFMLTVCLTLLVIERTIDRAKRRFPYR